MSKAIVQKRPAGKLADWQQEAALEAKDVAAREVIQGQRISFKGGQISVGGEAVGTQLPVLILDFCCGKAYYEEGYQEGVAQTPGCYAFGYTEADLAPHPAAPDKQSEKCASCPHNKMGSAEQGKGKRCKDERRLAVISSTSDDPEKTDIFTASISPTSIRNWANYVKYLKEQGQVPWSTFTEISLHSIKGKAYKEIKFTDIPGMTREMWEAVKVRRASGAVAEQLMAPYPNIEAPEPKPKRGRDKTK